MLSIAYGGDQSRALQLHLPEVCYVAQGFDMLKVGEGALSTRYGQVPVKRLVARQNSRNEPITYWITVGNKAIKSSFEQKIQRLAYGLSGKIPDGMLVRVSTIQADEHSAYRLQDRFVGQMLDVLDSKDRVRLLGSAGRTARPSDSTILTGRLADGRVASLYICIDPVPGAAGAGGAVGGRDRDRHGAAALPGLSLPVRVLPDELDELRQPGDLLVRSASTAAARACCISRCCCGTCWAPGAAPGSAPTSTASQRRHATCGPGSSAGSCCCSPTSRGHVPRREAVGGAVAERLFQHRLDGAAGVAAAADVPHRELGDRAGPLHPAGGARRARCSAWGAGRSPAATPTTCTPT